MTAEAETQAAWRESALRRTINWVLILGTAVAALTSFIVVEEDPAGLFAPLFLSMMLVFASLVGLRVAPISYRARARGFVLTIWVMSTLALLNFGLAPGPHLSLCLATIAAGVYLGRTALLLTLIGTTLSILGAGALVVGGHVTPVSAVFVGSSHLHWARAAAEYLLFGGSVSALLYFLILGLEQQEAVLAEKRRLEALGRLAGGVAHDFNNALQVVLTWADLLRVSDDPLVKDASREIEQAATQASRLTAQLLAFGRRDVWAPRQLDLGVEVERWATSMRRLVPEDVALETELADELHVECDPGQLEQILLNLVVNARDAMRGEGRITLRVDAISAPATMPDSERVARLRVTDDGPGIPEDARRHVFEPFFTTKGQVGTGLGLSIVHGAVSRAGGVVSVESTVGKGTTFTVLLPLTRPDEAAESAASPSVRRVPAGAVVLLAEDEDAIRVRLAACLREAGFEVLEAADGDAAMRLVETHDGPIDVLCTDGVMPGAPTREVIDRFRGRHPDGRVLVCSGHVTEELLRRQIDGEVLETLPKPFTPRQLLDKLQR